MTRLAAGVSRNGTPWKAITPEYYQQMAETARLKDAGLEAALELARLMGLRSQEAGTGTLFRSLKIPGAIQKQTGKRRLSVLEKTGDTG